MYSCVNINVFDFGFGEHVAGVVGVFAVSRCSPSWNESYIESRCISKNINGMSVYSSDGIN